MDLYTTTSYRASKLLTNAYSTSFGLSIRLFEASLRPHIYAIYGLVRIADEIVDTYDGTGKRNLLDSLEKETEAAMLSGYSTNPIVHAFAQTALQFSITKELTAPFFESMRMDLVAQSYDQKLYQTYIYGSAEVVGLMCLQVFTVSQKEYNRFESAAKKLGSAYQKVNFLRDVADDADVLGRWYFPGCTKATFDDAAKATILEDIQKDFAAAKKGVDQLPLSSRKAVQLSYRYYSQLLKKLEKTSAAQLLQQRVRISNPRKVALLVSTTVSRHKQGDSRA